MNNSTKPVIVVGASGSWASRAALRWAADEAGRLGGRLIAVRAWEPYHPAYYAPHAEYRDRDHERQAVAAELASTLRAVFGAEPPPDLLTEVREGMAERVLAERSAGADLLVLGSTSAPTVVGRSIGSVIRSCLSRAHCPVVVIGPEGTVGADLHREPAISSS